MSSELCHYCKGKHNPRYTDCSVGVLREQINSLRKRTDNDVTFKISAYWAHLLLKELEHLQRYQNRSTKEAETLWTMISQQLNGEVTDNE